MRSCLMAFFLLCSTVVWGQKGSVFTAEQLLWYVKNFHPVSVQGSLLIEGGESNLRRARGAFDPKLYGDFDNKEFDNKNYFDILGTGLKIPTWYGVEIKTGYDRNEGIFLNPQNNLPADGLWFGGLSVPIGQGLFIDKRRATLKQAELFAEATFAEQRTLINDLYFDAVKEYWNWVAGWNEYLVYEAAVDLAQTRFGGVRQSFVLGDLPAIDTLEAFIQVQNRQMLRNQAELNYQNLTLSLSNYLWFDNNTPLIITDSLRPPNYQQIEMGTIPSLDSFNTLLGQLASTHPQMQILQYQLAGMEVDRRLKAENLKPKLNLNYQVLNEPAGNEFYSNLSTENYKWGFNFDFPVFLREQRGDLELAKIKIENTEQQQRQKLLELQNKLRNYYNQQVNLENQVALYTDAVENYSRLLLGEQQKFNAGESSLFLVNRREITQISAQLKLIELISKFQTAGVGLVWATGQLFEE